MYDPLSYFRSRDLRNSLFGGGYPLPLVITLTLFQILHTEQQAATSHPAVITTPMHSYHTPWMALATTASSPGPTEINRPPPPRFKTTPASYHRGAVRCVVHSVLGCAFP